MAAKAHLDSVLWKLRLHGEHLARIHVGVVRLVKGLLQLFQLVGRKDRPAKELNTPLNLALLIHILQVKL